MRITLTRRLLPWSFVFVSLLAAGAPAQELPLRPAAAAAQTTTGEVRIKVLKAGFIVGLGGGEGTLTYAGQTYRLKVGGLGLGSLGIAAAELAGTATNLHSPSDIAGTYSAGGAGAAVIAGAQGATLQNDKGVVLTLAGVQAGFQVSLGVAGMTIELQ